MNSEITNRWIEAGKTLSVDSNAKVKCPVCESATLQVKDERSESEPSLLERHMTCPSCGAYNSLRLKRSLNQNVAS
jgi:C4-type Zn-finger protein